MRTKRMKMKTKMTMRMMRKKTKMKIINPMPLIKIKYVMFNPNKDHLIRMKTLNCQVLYSLFHFQAKIYKIGQLKLK